MMPNENPTQLNPRVGLLGELEVEIRLVQNGWHPVRLDTAQMASNADLLAVNRQHRVSIQVKTTDTHKQHSHSQWLGFGYSTGYVREKKSIFNSKDSPLIADVVIGVSYFPGNSRFVVMPVAFAEALCRLHCDYWSSVPTKKAGKRSDSFPIYLCFAADRKTHTEYHERVKRNVLKFEDAWQVLSEPLAKLHDAKRWPLLK
jgi:hypothetical protein